MQRYHTQCGSNPELKAEFFISDPQDADQLFPEIVQLLNRPGITRVDVHFNHGAGDRVEVIRKMPEGGK